MLRASWILQAVAAYFCFGFSFLSTFLLQFSYLTYITVKSDKSCASPTAHNGS